MQFNQFAADGEPQPCTPKRADDPAVCLPERLAQKAMHRLNTDPGIRYADSEFTAGTGFQAVWKRSLLLAGSTALASRLSTICLTAAAIGADQG